MSSKKDYAFFTSQDIDAEDAKNIHIFEGHYNREDETFLCAKKSCCGNCGLVSNAEWAKVAAECSDTETRKKARAIAKDYEDRGITVCGKCVAKLYSDKI